MVLLLLSNLFQLERVQEILSVRVPSVKWPNVFTAVQYNHPLSGMNKFVNPPLRNRKTFL